MASTWPWWPILSSSKMSIVWSEFRISGAMAGPHGPLQHLRYKFVLRFGHPNRKPKPKWIGEIYDWTKRIHRRKASGKPSTWLPPGGLAERSRKTTTKLLKNKKNTRHEKKTHRRPTQRRKRFPQQPRGRAGIETSTTQTKTKICEHKNKNIQKPTPSPPKKQTNTRRERNNKKTTTTGIRTNRKT